MTINFFSIEILLGLAIGLLLGFFIKNFFKKEEIKTGDYSRNLEILTKKIEDFQSENNKDRGSVSQILTDMRAAEQNIGTVAKELKNTITSGGGQKQGDWGQMVLEFILRDKLQFTEGEEFEVQKSFDAEEGRQIPDVIVHFPNNRDVIIDSKVSLQAWDEYVNSTDDRIKEEALLRHKKSMKTHIDSLSKKKYQTIKDINTLDTVIMFCPNESAISSLGEGSRKMMDYAISKKITLVGPTMLYYALKTVEYFWKTEKQSKNIKDVIDIANKLSSQAVEIYQSAKNAQVSIGKSSEGLDEILNKIKDGKGNFLNKIAKMNKIGGLSPKKQVPKDINDEDTDHPDDDDPSTGGIAQKIPLTEDEKNDPDLIANQKKH